MAKLVSLDGHKTAIERRKAKQMKRDVIKAAKCCAAGQGRISGYVVMTWDENANAALLWDTGKVFPAATLPDFARTEILRTLPGIVDDMGK